MSKPILRARGLHKSYKMGRSPLRVLRGISLRAHEGEFLVIQGPSGSGKSTLLHLLGALDVPDRGSVEFRDRDLFAMGDGARRVYRNRDIGFVFQFYHLLPELNVLQNVLIPRLVGCSLWRWPSLFWAYCSWPPGCGSLAATGYLAEVKEPMLDGQDDRVGAIVGVQFGQDLADIVLDRALAEV